MRAKSKLLALGLAAALQPAFAEVVTLNFNDPALWLDKALTTEIAGFSFTGDAWAVGAFSRGCGGDVLWTAPADAASKLGCGALELTSDPYFQHQDPDIPSKSFIINFTRGFVDELKFAFSLLEASGATIQVFEDLDGKGRELGNAKDVLESTPCTTSPWAFCEWKLDQSITILAGATAHSVKVSGLDQNLLLDNLSFITPSASTRLPEPGSVGLALSAIGALAWVRRRTTAAR